MKTSKQVVSKQLIIKEFKQQLDEIEKNRILLIFAESIKNKKLNNKIRAIPFLISSIQNMLMLGNYKNAYIKIYALKKILYVIESFKEEIDMKMNTVLFSQSLES